MQMFLTILILLLLLGLGVLGFRRGIQSGLLTLVGTLVAAALVDLWQGSIARQLGTWLHTENPNGWVLIVVSLAFLAVTLVVGYGSSVLLPRSDDVVAPDMRERIMATLVGILNGALIASYLIHYTITILDNGDFRAALTQSPVTSILHMWLPWFVLAIVIALGLVVIWRVAVRISQAIAISAGKNESIAAARSEDERFQAVDKKINKRIGSGSGG